MNRGCGRLLPVLRHLPGDATVRREEALAILTSHRNDLDRFDVKTLSIFGSVARDEAGPDSDVDILVEFTHPVSFPHLFALEDYLESLLGRRVDLTTPAGLKRQLRERVLREAIRAA